LAGITLPNDESCHVSQDGDGRFHYDHFRWLDYPSMAQISRQIANNSMNVIFAVPGSVRLTYQDLSSRLFGASVGELTDDSSNIVALVQDQYDVRILNLNAVNYTPTIFLFRKSVLL